VKHIDPLLVNEEGPVASLQPGVISVKVDVAAGASGLVLFQGVPLAAKLKAPHLLAHPGLAGEEEVTGVHDVNSKNVVFF